MDGMDEMGFEGYTQFKDRSTFIGDRIKAFPYNTLMVVWTAFSENPGQRNHGTAFLISPFYAITCAHNLFSSTCQFYESIEMRDPQRPDDAIEVCDFRVAEGFTINFKSRQRRMTQDFALLKLRQPVYRSKYMHFMAIQDVNEIKGQMAEVFGFPALEISHTDFRGKTHTDKILQIDKSTIKYLTDTGQGQSGSPIALKIENTYNLIGIHTQFYTKNKIRYNMGVFLNLEKLKTIEQWMKDMNIPKIKVYTLMDKTLLPSTLDEVLRKTNESQKEKEKAISEESDELSKKEIIQEPLQEVQKKLSIKKKESIASEYSTNSNRTPQYQKKNEVMEKQKQEKMQISSTKKISCFDISTNYFIFNWQIEEQQQRSIEIYAGRLKRKNKVEDEPIGYIISHEALPLTRKSVIKVNILNLVDVIYVGIITETTKQVIKTLIQTDPDIKKNIGMCSLITYEVSADIFQYGRIFKNLKMVTDVDESLYVDRGEFVGIEVDHLERKIFLYQNETKLKEHFNIDEIPIGEKIYFYVALGQNGDSVNVNNP